MKKALEFTWLTATVIVLVWLLISYFEVVTKNVAPDPVYSDWNMLHMIFGK